MKMKIFKKATLAIALPAIIAVGVISTTAGYSERGNSQVLGVSGTFNSEFVAPTNAKDGNLFPNDSAQPTTLAPGQSITASSVLKNNGTVPQKFRIVSQGAWDYTPEFSELVQANVKSNGVSIYDGKWNDVSSAFGTVDAGGSSIIDITLSLPLSAVSLDQPAGYIFTNSMTLGIEVMLPSANNINESAWSASDTLYSSVTAYGWNPKPNPTSWDYRCISFASLGSLDPEIKNVTIQVSTHSNFPATSGAIKTKQFVIPVQTIKSEGLDTHGFSQNTTYYFRAKSNEGDYTGWGSTQSVRTGSTFTSNNDAKCNKPNSVLF